MADVFIGHSKKVLRSSTRGVSCNLANRKANQPDTFTLIRRLAMSLEQAIQDNTQAILKLVSAIEAAAGQNQSQPQPQAVEAPTPAPVPTPAVQSTPNGLAGIADIPLAAPSPAPVVPEPVVTEAQTAPVPAPEPAPAPVPEQPRRGRGRPAGSKNLPKANDAPPTPTPTPTPAPVVPAPAPVVPAPPVAPATPTVHSIGTIKAAMMSVIKAKGAQPVVDILARQGVSTADDLPETAYEQVMQDLQIALMC